MALSKVGGNQIDTVSGDLTVDTNTLVVDSTNNKVGIGTTAPTYQTTVYGSSQSTVEIESGSDTGESRLYFTDPSTTGVGEIGYYHNGNSMRFGVNGAERMRVTSSGSVGISTTSPVANLEVEDGGTSNSILTKITADDQNPYALMIGNDSYSTTDTNAFGFVQRDDGAAYIYNAGSMRLVVDTDGDLGIGGTPGNIRFKISNTENKISQFIHTSNSQYSDNILEMETVRGQSDVFNHILIRTNNGGDAEFKVRGDGQVSADGSFSGGGADYAEYFEWTDGNGSSEDRRGYSVVLDGNKVRKATSDDAAASIIGIVSGNPAVVGDSRWNKWHGKHETDDYGTVVREADGTPKTASEYDASQAYVPRENRVEWDAVGMMGKLRMRKGQPTGDRWLKLRDISDAVEEWLVR
jgi:hypothetical protein